MSEKEASTNRIRLCAQRADELIETLAVLADRADDAAGSGNKDVAAYYEEEFTKSSVEFMDGVETILDEWHALRGGNGTRDANRRLSPDEISDIDNVVESLTGTPFPTPKPQLTKTPGAAITPQEPAPQPLHRPQKSRHKLDVEG